MLSTLLLNTDFSIICVITTKPRRKRETKQVTGISNISYILDDYAYNYLPDALAALDRLYTVSQKNVWNSFDTHEQILIFFGRNVTNKVGNQKVL